MICRATGQDVKLNNFNASLFTDPVKKEMVYK